MTQRLDPSLSIHRLLVVKGGDNALDLSFKPGVNILAGENDSGKSTVVELLYYALGGTTPSWKPEAGSCDTTFAEVSLNGSRVTLRREIEATSRRPMAIAWEPLERARRDAVEGWEVFPFAASARKQSFSQVLIRALGIPEALQEDLGSRITMHQLLRLIYVDQRTPFDEIFMSDDFDSPMVRQAVGDLMLGLYQPAIYDLKLKLSDSRKKLDEVNAQRRGAAALLRDADTELSPDLLRQEREEKIEQRGRLQAELARLHDSVDDDSEDPEGLRDDQSEAIETLRADLSERKLAFRELTEKIEALDYDIEDSRHFIAAISNRIKALDESGAVQEALGTARFEFCPACFTPVGPSEDQAACPLCGREEGLEELRNNLARVRHELSMQLEESRALQADREARRNRLSERVPSLKSEVVQLQERFDHLTAGVRTVYEERIGEINRTLGYLNRHIEDIERRIRLAEVIEELGVRRKALHAEIADLEDRVDEAEEALAERREAAEERVGVLAAEILKKDLHRQRAFEKAERVTFDFGGNDIAVGGKSSFGASSGVLLKNAFHLGLLYASTQESYFRYPRIAIIDNIEDKGMEQARSHNFQEVIVARSEDVDVDHQVIFSTSMLSPKLEGSRHVIAHFHPDEKSLKV